MKFFSKIISAAVTLFLVMLATPASAQTLSCGPNPCAGGNQTYYPTSGGVSATCIVNSTGTCVATTTSGGNGGYYDPRYQQNGGYYYPNQQQQQQINPCKIDGRFCRPSTGDQIKRDLVGTIANGVVNSLLIAAQGGQQRRTLVLSGQVQQAVDTNRAKLQAELFGVQANLQRSGGTTTGGTTTNLGYDPNNCVRHPQTGDSFCKVIN